MQNIDMLIMFTNEQALQELQNYCAFGIGKWFIYT